MHCQVGSADCGESWSGREIDGVPLVGQVFDGAVAPLGNTCLRPAVAGGRGLGSSFGFTDEGVDRIGRHPDCGQLTKEVDGVSLVPLFRDATEDGFSRPQKALFFHRPRRSFSAIRENDYKLMLYWNKDGSIDRQELYRVDRNPMEAGNEITDRYLVMAKQMRDRLLAQFYFLNAERFVPRWAIELRNSYISQQCSPFSSEFT